MVIIKVQCIEWLCSPFPPPIHMLKLELSSWWYFKCGLWMIFYVWSLASLIAQLVKNLPAMQETPVKFLGRKIHWRRHQLPTLVFLGFPVAQLVKNPPAMQETWVQSLGREDPLEKGKGYPLQYSGLENSMDCIVHGVAKSRTWLSDLHLSVRVIRCMISS